MSLFQTRAWQDTWWSEWGGSSGFSLVRSGGDGLSGLYLDQYRFRGILPIRCLQFVGTNYRRLSTPRTEYNRLVAQSSEERAKSQDLTEVLGLDWSEAVFRDLCADSADITQLKGFAETNGLGWRVVATDTAYAVDTSSSDLTNYLSKLGRNTRLKLYNRRKVLTECGDIHWSNAWPNDVDWFFDRLNRFHEKRWGTACFNNRSLAFHRRFMAAVAEEGGHPRLSVMWCDGEPISLLYNVLYERTMYNLQSGFHEQFHRKLALGYLHLGYAIEEAFADSQVDTFDLLAGNGKNTNYKAHIATQTCNLISVMLVRSRLLKCLYKLKN